MGKLFVLSAPSGAGKTSLTNAVLRNIGERYKVARVITYTSKTPRSIEQHGKDYHFVSACEFEEKISQGFFIEWSSGYGAYYGSPRSILNELDQGTSYILIIDRPGAIRIKEVFDAAILIWIYTQSIAVLEQRLRIRNTETDEHIMKRLLLAEQELNEEKINSLYHYHVLNDDFDQAVETIEQILISEIKRSSL